ncbi:MAG: outer membrane beta-barrel protein [Bacteroidaceae bacterium]|nr:outer membrane beta-barrel protein [Bacteroidaceae bacterium]
MKKPLAISTLLILCLSQSLLAQVSNNSQTVQPDTLLTNVNLDEIVIEASPVIRKADKDLYTPSTQAREYAKNGVSLLYNMQIPTLNINTVMETITNASGAVQVRINGREATYREVQNLQPESIARVEYRENPGLRYNGANAVLDFIVRNPTVGGSFSTSNDIWMTKRLSGNSSNSLKLNRGKGQIGLSLTGQLRNNMTIFREYHENILFADGTLITRTETPRDGSKFNQRRIEGELEYTYIDPDKFTFYASLSLERMARQTMEFEGLMASSIDEKPVLLSQMDSSPYTIPSLNLYFDKQLGNDQSLVVDFVAEFDKRRSEQTHIETEEGMVTPLTDIHTTINDRNWTFGLETNYIKEWENSQLTAGLSWNGNRNRSTYITSDNALFHQRRDKFYGFAEFMYDWDEVSLTAGAGVEYNDLKLRESDKQTSSWNFIPQVTVVWDRDWSNLRFTMRGWSSTPTLSQTNPTVQQIDRFQYQVGNPDLQGYSNWSANLNWAQNFRRLNTAVQFGYQTTSGNAIAAHYYWNKDNQLITTFTNGNRNRSWWGQASASIKVIPQWFTLNTYIKMVRYNTTGKDFHHHFTSLSGNVSAILSHYGFQLSFLYFAALATLEGENMSRGETFSNIDLSYKWRKWQFGVGMHVPFGRYSTSKRLYNRFYNYKQTLRSHAVERCLTFNITYNLNWGKQKHGAEKLTSVSTESMQSKAAGR